jgi:type II secretory pathway component GspD/PulD (secretin)
MTRVRIALGAALALGVVAAICLTPSTATFGQETAQRPRPRTLMKTAHEHYKRGDYEAAAEYYGMAQASFSDLSPTEQQDLVTRVGQNNVALQARREGGAQLRQAEEALRQGNTAEASNLLKAAGSNQYLSGTDRQSLMRLNDGLRSLAAAQRQMKEVATPRADSKTLLNAARTALARGDLDAAENLARQAEKAGSSGLFSFTPPWADSPAKVMREVQTVRAKQPAVQTAGFRPPETNPPQEPKEGFAPFQSMKKLFGREEKKPAGNDGPILPPMDGGMSPRGRGPEKTSQAGGSASIEGPRLPEPGNNSMTRIGQAPAEAKRPALKLNIPENADARTLLREARNLYQKNHLEEAEFVCAKAAARQERWGLFEDSPDKLRQDILKSRKTRDRQESVRLLADGRKQLAQGRYKEARACAWQAEKLHGPYSVWDFGDRPQRLLAEIEKAERERPQAARPPQEGAPLTPNDPRQSRNNLTGPDAKQSPYAQNQTAKPAPQQSPNLAPQRPNEVAGNPLLAKQRALALLAEARGLQKKGFLIEARQKAMEARQLDVVFSGDEDSPEMALPSLAAQCDRQIQHLLQTASDRLGGSDPARFQKADEELAAARKLAQAFGQDLTRIEQKVALVQQMRNQAGGLPAVPSVDPLASADPSRRKGLELLEKARLELRAGNTRGARRLAEEAFAGSHGVQDLASAMLRSIDAEEHNQMVFGANRTADAGIEAYLRRDFRMAASILGSVDARLLWPDRQARVREIMGTAEMQMAPLQTVNQQKIKQVTGQDGPGHASASDLPGNATAREDGLMDQYRALEEVQFQQLHQGGLAVQRKAMEHFRNGDLARAQELLREYLDQLGKSQLDPERTALLRRPVENRLQQYRTIEAQKKLEQEQIQLVRHNTHNEGERVKQLRKLQDEVADLLRRSNTLRREGKYKEALAEARKAKELDPDNVAADYQILSTTILINQIEHDRIKGINEQRFVDALNNDMGPDVNMKNPLAFDHAAQSRVRNREEMKKGIVNLAKQPWEIAIERKLNMPITFSFKDQSLNHVIYDLKTLSGVNIVLDTAALNDAGISLEQPLTLAVENISLKSALNILFQQVRLTYVIKNEVLMITTRESGAGNYITKTYQVADLVVPVDNHPRADVNSFQKAMERHIATQSGVQVLTGATPYNPAFALTQGTTVSSQSTGLSGSTMPVSMSGPQGMTPRHAPGQTLEDSLISLITGTVSANTWESVGGQGKIRYYPLGMALVVNQTQEVQEEIFALLEALRRLLDLEIAVEMRIVSISEEFFERMGLDFDLNFVQNHSRHEPNLVTGQFQNFPFINKFQPSRFVTGLTPAGTFTPDLNIPIRSSSFDFSIPPFGGYPGTIGADGGLSLGLAFLSDIQVFMFLEAAQADKRTQIMQAPKLTVFNGQTATIDVNDQIFFLLGVTLTQSQFGQMFFQPNNQPIPVGVGMLVTPVVSADRRFVRLNLIPTITSLISPTSPLIPLQIPVPSSFQVGGGTLAGPPDTVFQMFFQQPAFTTITVSTTVNVPDGGTVLLGGMKVLAEGRQEAGPPILSKIPYISRLFRNTAYGRTAFSIMIMVTPRIIINEEEERIYRGLEEVIPRQ